MSPLTVGNAGQHSLYVLTEVYKDHKSCGEMESFFLECRIMTEEKLRLWTDLVDKSVGQIWS